MTYETPEAAYEAFFTHFNAEDAPAWANVMHYPHVRVSAGSGRSMYYETSEEYAAGSFWDRSEEGWEGWVRTQGITPVRIHESDERVHLAGGWTRYNAAGEPIRSNRVTYILTRLATGWGIQARFGTDSFDEGEDTARSEQAALEVIQRHLDAWDTGDLTGCAAVASYPLTDVGIGTVARYESASDYEATLAAQNWSATASHNIHAHQVGRTGVNISVTATLADSTRAQALFLVAQQDEVWAITARSRIDS
jgi:hypothetical protein